MHVTVAWAYNDLCRGSPLLPRSGLDSVPQNLWGEILNILFPMTVPHLHLNMDSMYIDKALYC